MADYAIHDTTLTDISNVIRKKEGSSALIDPAKYAERINYMGMLEKKIIVSSPICDFADGSDDVPTDFVKITMPASLTGYNSASVVNSGNLCDFDNYNVEANTNTTVPLGADLTLKKGTYTLSFNISDTVTATRNRPCYVVNGNYTYADSDYKTSGRYSWTFTLADDTTLSIRWWAHTVSANITISDFMLTHGSTAHAYEPYQTPTQYTASLGRTVHGAEVDLANGEGESLCGKIVFDGSESRWSAYTTGNGYAIPLTGMKRGTWYTSPLALSYPLPKAPNNDNLGVRIGVNNDGIYVVQANTIEGVTDLTSFKAWLSENPLTIIYPLDVTEDFTFDGQEIPTRLGYNCFISEDGDTSVAYRASGTIYNYPRGEEASF